MSEGSIEGQKSIGDELQHCSAESEAKKVGTLNINDTETVHHTDSLDSFELIDYPDPDEIQIAGFNKKKLLEMSHFCKITYGNNDPRLSQLGYKTRAEFIEEGHDIIPFYYSNKTLAGFVFTKGEEITIAYRGTQYPADIITDMLAILIPLEFLPEGGRAHYGFYSSFHNSFDNKVGSLSHVLETHANEKKLAIKDFKFYLTGHSMGGAIAKIAALFLNKKFDVQNLHVATFADPRVFDLTASESYNKALPNRTIRVTQHRCDPVPAVAPGFLGYVHVGEQLRISVISGHTAHKIDGYHYAINSIKENDFQPDNSASIFYYPVRLLILINDIVLGNSQYYAANFIRYFLYQDTSPICCGNTEDTRVIQYKHDPVLIVVASALFDYTHIDPQLRINDFQSDNNISTFYSSIRVLTPVNKGVLAGLFNGIDFNINSSFRRKAEFVIQGNSFSHENKKIKAIQNLNLVKINDQQKNDNLLDYVSFDKKEDTQQPEIQSSITEDFDSTEDLNFKPYAKLPMLNTSSSIVVNDYQTQVIVDKVASNNRELSLTKKAVYATMIASPFIAVGIYAAVALSAGIVKFNPVIAAGIFIGVVALSATCFAIMKVSEEKGRDPNINLSTALNNALTLECLRNNAVKVLLSC